jgi:hypothetical protein
VQLVKPGFLHQLCFAFRHQTKLVNKQNHELMAEYVGERNSEMGRGTLAAVRINAHAKKTYASPILRRLTLQQVKIVLSSKIKNIFSRAVRSNRPKVVSITSKSKKHYQKPGYKKLTPEQIKLILIGKFNLGDESAGDLLDQLFSESHTRPGQGKENV